MCHRCRTSSSARRPAHLLGTASCTSSTRLTEAFACIPREAWACFPQRTAGRRRTRVRPHPSCCARFWFPRKMLIFFNNNVSHSNFDVTTPDFARTSRLCPSQLCAQAHGGGGFSSKQITQFYSHTRRAAPPRMRSVNVGVSGATHHRGPWRIRHKIMPPPVTLVFKRGTQARGTRRALALIQRARGACAGGGVPRCAPRENP